jgi:hydrogenase-4 component F
LSSGNILLGYGSKLIAKTGNMAKVFPKTFVAFFAGFVGISGFPPFGIFVSELLIIMGAFQQGRSISITIFILALVLIFAGASRLVMKMSFGKWDDEILLDETMARVLPSYALLLTSIILCIWLPDSLYQKILSAIATVGGSING